MYEYSSFLTFLVGYDRKISVEFVDLYIILKVITIKRYLIKPEVVVFTGKSKYPFLMYFKKIRFVNIPRNHKNQSWNLLRREHKNGWLGFRYWNISVIQLFQWYICSFPSVTLIGCILCYKIGYIHIFQRSMYLIKLIVKETKNPFSNAIWVPGF